MSTLFSKFFWKLLKLCFSLAVCGCWPWPTIDYYTLTPFCCQLLFFAFFCLCFLRVFFLLITYFYSTIVLTFNKSNLFWSSCISNANIVFHLIYINLKSVFIIALSIAIRV